MFEHQAPLTPAALRRLIKCRAIIIISIMYVETALFEMWLILVVSISGIIVSLPCSVRLLLLQLWRRLKLARFSTADRRHVQDFVSQCSAHVPLYDQGPHASLSRLVLSTFSSAVAITAGYTVVRRCSSYEIPTSKLLLAYFTL